MQLEYFDRQMTLAEELDIPVVIALNKSDINEKKNTKININKKVSFKVITFPKYNKQSNINKKYVFTFPYIVELGFNFLKNE